MIVLLTFIAEGIVVSLSVALAILLFAHVIVKLDDILDRGNK